MLSACDSSSGGVVPGRVLSDLQLSPSNSVVLVLGTPLQLTLQTFDSNGQPYTPPVAPLWQSDNESVISVDSSGVITAHQNGTAAISVSVGNLRAQALITVDTSATPLAGNVSYEDWTYNATDGHVSPSVAKPVRYAQINLLDEQGQVMDSTNTGLGSYQFHQWLPQLGEVQVQASADDAGKQVEVRDVDGSLHEYRRQVSASSGNFDLLVSEVETATYGAFNILDVMFTGHEFIQSYVSGSLPALNVFWRPGSWIDSSYYCNDQQPTQPGYGCDLGPGIYIINESLSQYLDSDEFDDDVLWHEYGHFIAYNFSRDDSLGGCHTFDDSFQQLPLSWSEGWGNFFQSAVKSWMTPGTRSSLEPYSVYVDTMRADPFVYSTFDFANPTGGMALYASSEATVTKILLDTMQQYGFAAIWQLITSTEWKDPVRRANLELFWDIAVGRTGGVTQVASASLLEPLFTARSVDYVEDGYEPNNDELNATTLVAGPAQTHTLYLANGQADSDWFVIPNVQVDDVLTIKTSNLRNGTDTEMWLYVDDGVGNLMEITSNNDYIQGGFYYSNPNCGTLAGNTMDGFASQIQYTAQQSGNYYVKVSNSHIPEIYTGQYGSYQIELVP